MIVKANFYINGKKINAPNNWQSTKVIATFDAETNNSQIDSDRFEFVLEAAQEIIKYYEGGLNGGFGITEGLPLRIELTDSENVEGVFNGYIDFFKDFEIVNNQVVLCGVQYVDEIVELRQRMAGTSVDLLKQKGFYNDGDFTNLNYVVEKEINAVELVVMLITIYLFLKEIYESSLRLAETIAIFTGILTGGGVANSSIGAAIFTSLKILAQVAYIALMVTQVIKLVKDMFSYLISPNRNIKGISFYNLIAKAVESFGYSFESEIEELEKYYYYPSLKGDDNNRGIPNPSDYGYTVSEIVDLMETCFYAKSVIIGNTFYLNWLGSDFWDKQSPLRIDKQSPDKRSRFKPNINEIDNTQFVSFRTDQSDVWTLKDFTGTNYEVTTEQKVVKNSKNVGIKGLNESQINLALASSKRGFNDVENGLLEVAKIANQLINAVGGSGKLGQNIEKRIGSLKIGAEQFDVAKAVYLQGGKIPSNQRDFLSAKYLYENFHYEKSFVQSDSAQKLIYEDSNYPFTYNDFLKIKGNNKIVDWNGRKGEVKSLEFSFDKDFAEIEFSVNQKYTVNLKETKIEA